jgi:hypothetical protein
MLSPRPSIVAVVAILGALPLMGTVCTARGICDKRAQCEDEENDRQLEPDSIAVCAAEYETSINKLYANEEDECHRLAEAIVALDNCKMGLKCDDFVEGDLGGECDDQLDALEDAFDDVDGNECTAQED